MARILDRGSESEISQDIIDYLDGTGYTSEEIIPALVRAIGFYANQSFSPDACLDEAANLLADVEL